MTKIYDFSRTG